ncbi:hypothetical protein HYQ46_000169 [Verticillium longisporum]|nr:hypothetical protein HYQ46_000169 [Verticillium longisporum]
MHSHYTPVPPDTHQPHQTPQDDASPRSAFYDPSTSYKTKTSMVARGYATSHWPEYMRLEEAVQREDDLFGPLLAESINLYSFPSTYSHGQDDVFLDLDPETAALFHPAPIDLPDLDFTLPTCPSTPVNAVAPSSPLSMSAAMARNGGACPRCGAHRSQGRTDGRGWADFDTRLARMEATMNDTVSTLARMEATMNETASAFQSLLPRAYGAMQNLIDITILFDESMEKLKRSMGLFTRGIVEHFFGDATLADAETFNSCDP